MASVSKSDILNTKMAEEAEGSIELSRMSCADFAEFKEALKKLRLVDDKIIYNLNVSVPTVSFKAEINAESKCRSLYQKLLDIYKVRETAIKDCIDKMTTNVEELKAEREKNMDDFSISKTLRTKQLALRTMQSELMVEEVVKQRSLKVFNERCWKSYKPPKDL